MMWMCLHYMVLYYKANRLIEKISIFLLQLMCSAEDSNPDSPSACFPLSRRNPPGFSGISQPGKASPGPRAVAPEPQSLPSLALPKKYQRLLLGGGTGEMGVRAGGQDANSWGRAWVGGWRARRSCVRNWAQQPWGTSALWGAELARNRFQQPAGERDQTASTTALDVHQLTLAKESGCGFGAILECGNNTKRKEMLQSTF